MHQGSLPVQKGASSSYVEQGWDALSDDQLLRVQWSTDDPLALPNIQSTIPVDLGEFQIELAYDLSPDDTPVPCAHCPQHQRHRHGFVLRDDRDRRYLLGSTCGPKAYGSDYRLASNARGQAKRRYDLLKRWITISADVPNRVTELAVIASSPFTRILRSGRQRLEQKAPRTLARLRQLRPAGNDATLRLIQIHEERDRVAEEALMETFIDEVRALADLGLTNREHNRRHAEIKERLGAGRPIIKIVEIDHGVLRGAEWIRSNECAATGLADAVARLRGLAAIGQVTQDKTTPRLSQIVKQAEADLERADQCAAAILAAKEFFEPRHLAAVCAWLNGGINPPSRSSSIGAQWRVAERSGEAVSIDANSVLP